VRGAPADPGRIGRPTCGGGDWLACGRLLGDMIDDCVLCRSLRDIQRPETLIITGREGQDSSRPTKNDHSAPPRASGSHQGQL
jgi:hypothetical protein